MVAHVVADARTVERRTLDATVQNETSLAPHCMDNVSVRHLLLMAHFSDSLYDVGLHQSRTIHETIEAVRERSGQVLSLLSAPFHALSLEPVHSCDLAGTWRVGRLERLCAAIAEASWRRRGDFVTTHYV